MITKCSECVFEEDSVLRRFDEPCKSCELHWQNKKEKNDVEQSIKKNKKKNYLQEILNKYTRNK